MAVADVEARSANKIIYCWKRIKHDALTDKMSVLGLQGATSGTHTRALQSTATKTANIKSVGSANEQIVVDVIFQNPAGESTDLWLDLYNAWANGEIVAIWRVDLNTISGVKPSRTVQASYAQCLIPNLPNTEGLGAAMNANITFEVNGMARVNDSNEAPFTLSESDLPDGFLDDATKFYNYSHGTDVGIDSTTKAYKDNTSDDSTAGAANSGSQASGK